MAELQIRDLREWLDEVEKIGELLCINEEVDPHLEMSAITYLVAKNPMRLLFYSLTLKGIKEM
jgi:UbiD family decarboxylase